MFSFLYKCSFGIVGTLYSLWVLCRGQVKHKNTFFKRWGCGFPKIEKEDGFNIWIHAVSVGETRAVAPLAKLIKDNYPSCSIVISSVTQTGHNEALKTLPFACAHVFLPFDSQFIIRRLLKKYSPTLVLITETDIWYQFIKTMKEKGAKIALINGKISQRSYDRLSRFKWIARNIYHLLDLALVQNEEYKRKLIDLGTNQKETYTCGNIKINNPVKLLSESEKSHFYIRLGLDPKDKILVIGSTHEKEEEWLLNALEDVWKENPNAIVVIVPRHPERFPQVAQLLKQSGRPFVAFSEGKKLSNEKILLVDAMGVLLNFYQIATLAIVGGSFVDHVGGHNLLEPIFCSVPVLYGPHMFSQPDLTSLVENSKAGKQVQLNEVAHVVNSLLASNNERQLLIENGMKLKENLQGPLQNTYDLIVQKLL